MASTFWPEMALPPPDRRGPAAAPVPFLILAGAGVAFFVLPLLGLLVRTPWGSARELLTSSEALTALRLSLIASLSATAIALLLGVPLARVHARVPLPRGLARDPAAGAAVAGGRGYPLLGAGAGRVRRHHHICRQLSGAHADHAPGGLPGTGDQPGIGDRTQPRFACGLARCSRRAA